MDRNFHLHIPTHLRYIPPHTHKYLHTPLCIQTNLHTHTYRDTQIQTHTQNLKGQMIQSAGVRQKQPGYEEKQAGDRSRKHTQSLTPTVGLKGDDVDFIPPEYLFIQLTWRLDSLRLAKHEASTKSCLSSLKNADATGPASPSCLVAIFKKMGRLHWVVGKDRLSAYRRRQSHRLQMLL